MKTTHNNTMVRLAGTIIVLALFVGTAGEVRAQKGVLAAKLLEFSGRSVAPKTDPNNSKPMSCSKCKDVFVTQADKEMKGFGAKTLASHGTPTIKVAKHLCGGCGRDRAAVGAGKGKEVPAIHTCTSCSAESLACCGTKKGSDVTTKGMEKKFEIAPLK